MVSLERKVLTAFKKKKAEKIGFLRATYWTRKIKDITDHEITAYHIRKLFHGLVDKGYFYRQKTPENSYLYEFKLKNIIPIVEKKTSVFTVDFD